MNLGVSHSSTRLAAKLGAAIAAMVILVGGTEGEAFSQTAGLPGPYTNYNSNQYSGPIYYNSGYAQYGLPGVGVSPWNPIVQAQLNLGMRTARYNMYSAWADQSNAAANLYYQQAVSQQLQNQQQAQAMQVRYDVQTRAKAGLERQFRSEKAPCEGRCAQAQRRCRLAGVNACERDARQGAKRSRSSDPGGSEGV